MIARLRKTVSVLAVLLLMAACVTVNIYFPAAEVKRDAERIVEDVYQDVEEEKKQDEGEKSGSRGSMLHRLAGLLGPKAAQAQDVTAVSNAAIRGLKDQIAGNLQQLKPFLDAGNVGINGQGYLELRNTEGMQVSQVAQVKRLIAQDKGLRDQLYQEVAKARDTDQVGKVRGIFAETWKSKAKSGWYVQRDGNWVRK